MHLEQFLKGMVKHGASDLFVSAGAPPGTKIEGKTKFLGEHRLSSAETRELAYSVLSDRQSAEFEREMEMNLALALDGIGRFRVNMREAPDVILIGKIRDRETMQHAIAYAETGHLCLSTLHANNANQAQDHQLLPGNRSSPAFC